MLKVVLLEHVLPSRLGHLRDRWGRKPLITAGLTWAGLRCLCLPWLPAGVDNRLVDAENARARRRPAPQKAFISDLTEDATRGTGYGLHICATSLSSAIGPLVGGWVYDTHGHITPFLLTGMILLASLG
jgi:MFS family permease